VACAQIPGDAGSVSTTSISTTSTDVVTTTMQVTSSTFAPPSTTSTVAEQTTTSMVAEQTVGAPPKPEGEPDIELLPEAKLGDVVYDPTNDLANGGETPNEYFSFQAVSGYDSFTVTWALSYEGGDESGTDILEGRVDGASFYVSTQTGDMRDMYEVIVSPDPESLDPESWIRVDGGWIPVEFDPQWMWTLLFVLPEATQGTLFDTFDTLTFVDWDLIDGVWYARYAASDEFVAANLGYHRNPGRLVDAEGDVWISPKGFVHSYEISATDGQDEVFARSTWRLSDLGTTSIDVPNT